jgi:hypothetical protein
MKHDPNDAAYYQAHKDDPEEWGEAEKSAEGTRRGGMGATITVRFPADEARALYQLARREHLTLSNIVRAAVRQYCQPTFSVQSGVIQVSFAPRDVTGGSGRLIEVADSLKPFMATKTGSRAGLRYPRPR